ncbi:hypothetical protein NPIL_70991 [Nephila pilipes]|uniref:Uncharacterized protein n=1 Tax=Nephila pilipes TaxID=299642 RepID=A0A8X6MUP5_NEPPI|nr:hypothetical protein NPIL_70991 [Nephila pilipes]
MTFFLFKKTGRKETLSSESRRSFFSSRSFITTPFAVRSLHRQNVGAVTRLQNGRARLPANEERRKVMNKDCPLSLGKLFLFVFCMSNKKSTALR